MRYSKIEGYAPSDHPVTVDIRACRDCEATITATALVGDAWVAEHIQLTGHLRYDSTPTHNEITYRVHRICKIYDYFDCPTIELPVVP